MAPSNPARFISEAKVRIGKCITFGCTSGEQYSELYTALRTLNKNWRRIAVGREGFLTSPEKAGLSRHQIAWGDHDQMGHVNNVVYNFWAETARINWSRRFAMAVEDDAARREMWMDLVSPRGIGMILRSIKTEYKFPLRYPDRITVIHKLLEEPKRGMDRFLLEAVVLSETHQRIAAKITEDIAVYDYRIGKKAPLPDFMIDALKKEWREQEMERQNAGQQIKMVERRVRKLEQDTWDREDAVEDLGSAAEIQNPKKATDGDETPLELQVGMKA